MDKINKKHKQNQLFYNFVYVIKKWGYDLRYILIFNLLYAIVMGVLPILSLSISKKIMNLLELKQEYIYLIFLVIAMFFISYMQLIISYINSVIYELNSFLLEKKINVEIYTKISKINLDVLDTPQYFELYDKIHTGSNMNPVLFFEDIFQIVQNTVLIISYCYALLFNQQIELWQKAVVLLSAISAAIVRKKLLKTEFGLNTRCYEESNIFKRKSAIFNKFLHLSHIHDEIKIYNAFPYFKDLIETNNYNVFKINKTYKYRIHNYNRLGAVIALMIRTIAYIMLLREIFYRRISYGDYVLLYGILEGIFNAIMSYSSNISNLAQNLYYVTYIKEFLNLNENIFNKGELYLKEFDEIEFRNVYFKYPNTDHYVLNGVSFIIKKGQTIGIIGLNASGKSTLLKLLMRLYEAEKGEVLINKINIKQYKISSLYKLFSVVFQDFCKYSLSIQEYIMGNDLKTVTNCAKMEQALEKAQLLDYVLSLPHNYDTLLTKEFSGDAIDLSIGQWQKLNIAKMYYADRKIIILDEPSASLDIISESAIFEQLEKNLENKTILFISHNLANVKQCDNIMFLKNGIVLAQGNHSWLMHNCDDYVNLFKSQASRFV